MRVALYCRVSSQEQARNGLSLADQETCGREWVKANGHQLVDAYIDAGISGRKPAKKRPELMRLLGDIESGLVDLVVFTKLDRWFRNVAQYYFVQEVLDKHHVSWKALLEDYETVTAAGRLKVNILLAVSEEEADRTSERLKFTFAQKKARGEACNGNCSLGIKVVDKKYVKNEQAQIAHDMFMHFIGNRNLADTVRWLKNSCGIEYTVSGMKYLLMNETYKTVGIVSEEDWNFTQEIIESRKTGRSARLTTDRVYLFSGLIYCPECGGRMYTCPSRGYQYYLCYQQYKKHRCPNSTHVNETKLERYLLENILLKVDDYNVSVREANRKPTITAEAVQKKKDKLADLYLNDRISKEKYDEEFKKIQQIEIPVTKKEISLPEMRTALDAYGALTQQRKKEFWSRILRRITVDQNKNIEFELR